MSAAPNTTDTYPLRATDPELNKLYATLLRARRVAIVGPAATIRGSAQKELIDSYDVIVRINNQWPPDPKLVPDIGSRADVIYHCCNGKSPIARLNVPGFAACRFAWYEANAESADLVELCRRHDIPSACYDEFQKTLIEKLSTVPNTGLLAIAHMLTTELKELYVTGFSFHATGYYEGYVGTGARPKYWRWWRSPKRIGPHRFEPQRSYFRALCDSDARLTVDAPLKRLLAHW
jgi:hypothetical protein